jgi:hypothetical protein
VLTDRRFFARARAATLAPPRAMSWNNWLSAASAAAEQLTGAKLAAVAASLNMDKLQAQFGEKKSAATAGLDLTYLTPRVIGGWEGRVAAQRAPL